MSFNLPNPGLFGILLVISTHSGPLLVYNYPQDLSEDTQSAESSDDDDLSYEDKSVDQEEIYEAGYSYGNEDQYKHNEWDSRHLNYYMGTKKDLLPYLEDQENNRRIPKGNQKPTKAKEKSKSSNNGTILGMEPAYLCEMLAPPKSMCNSRFEITIDDRIFLGLPIHKMDDGSWRPLKKKGRPSKDVSESTPKVKENLIMFHLVFILNPPIMERNYRIDEMFHYVISRLSLVLRFEQHKTSYISNQLRLMIALREESDSNSGGSDVSNFHSIFTEKSSLCKLISVCYTAISKSKIANLSINGTLRSFQIPIKTEFHSLPETSVPYLPGSYLSSTTNLLLNTGLINVGQTSRYGHAGSLLENDETSSSLDDIMHLALLLLYEPDKIIRDIVIDPESKFANFIYLINPTVSILKLASDHKMDLKEVKSFLSHLIYWRRARVMQPINTRSVYTVSPMAPILQKAFEDIAKFSEIFPTLPSLTHFLKQLSPQFIKPQQFASIIPSRDHRSSYLDALGWLIRNGYVIQLQTFIWLKISPKVKLRVEEDLENEATLTKKRSQGSKIVTVGGTDNTSKVQSKDAITGGEELVQRDDTIEALQKRLTAIGPSILFGEEEESIILDPGRATTLERKWINRIIFEECKLTHELTTTFYKLLKYMNGKSSLEMLLLKENISRNELRRLLFEIEDHIITVRHW